MPHEPQVLTPHFVRRRLPDEATHLDRESRGEGRLLPARTTEWDDLANLVISAPALPTLFPCAEDVLRQCARLVVSEGFPALEMLARPMDRLLPVLRNVFKSPERTVVRWGIGTITSREAALEALQLSPDFLVSPAFSHRVLEVAVEAGVPYLPGVQSFQDVQDVIDAFDTFGLKPRVLKLCPVFNITPQYVEGIRGCFPGISFCPTGEINLENFVYWKRLPGIVAPMGADLLPTEIIARGDIEAMRERLQLLRALSTEANAAK